SRSRLVHYRSEQIAGIPNTAASVWPPDTGYNAVGVVTGWKTDRRLAVRSTDPHDRAHHLFLCRSKVRTGNDSRELPDLVERQQAIAVYRSWETVLVQR